MEIIKKTVNFYGDTLVEIKTGEALSVFLNELNTIASSNTTIPPYILHINCENDHIETIPNFVYITKRNNIAVYANESVIKKCPKLINETVSGSTVVLQVKYDDTLYNVFVKDRTKKFITNPAGTLEHNESYEKCASRECKEETGLDVEISEKDLIGTFGYIYTLFEMKWPGEAKIYKCVKTISKDEFESLKGFECDEIEKVYLVQSHLLENVGEMTLDGVPVSSHHLLAARYVQFKVDWEVEKPTYLKDFKLF